MAEGGKRFTLSQAAKNRLASQVTSTTTSITYSAPSSAAARPVPSHSMGTVRAMFSPMMSDSGPRFTRPSHGRYSAQPPIHLYDSPEDVKAQVDQIRAKLSNLDDREDELESSTSASDHVELNLKQELPLRESPALFHHRNPLDEVRLRKDRQDRLGESRPQHDHALHLPPGEYGPLHRPDPSRVSQQPRFIQQPSSGVSDMLQLLAEERRQDREERRQDQEERRLKDEREAEERRLKDEREAEERRLKDEREAEEKRLEREERRQDREIAAANVANAGQGRDQVPRPHLKLPELKAGDDVDDFLSHFESVVNSFHLSEQDKILYLTGSLMEKARRTFVSMPSGSSYAELQGALRKAYYLSTETYRKKFRDERKKADETFIIFGERLTRSLDSWVAIADAPLKDIILTEQLWD
ncbi:hypothetical protein ACOMHN_006077 [Nucella lapillus]